MDEDVKMEGLENVNNKKGSRAHGPSYILLPASFDSRSEEGFVDNIRILPVVIVYSLFNFYFPISPPQPSRPTYESAF